MTNTPGDQQLRTQLHEVWNSVASGWAANIDHIEQRGARVTDLMLDAIGPEPGRRILELACGTGATGLAAARRFGPGSTVTVSDVAPDMVAVAAERAAEQGVGNVATTVLDIEQIEMPDGVFDAVLCREGLMFAVDPGRGLAEIRRVLVPRGPVSVAVWGVRDKNPWLGVLFDAVSAELGFAVPPPGLPGPFSLSDPGRLRELFVAAGFLDVTITEVYDPFVAPDFESWWVRVSAMSGPLATMLKAMNPDMAESLTGRLRELVAPYETDAGVELPGLAMVASAHRD